MSHRKQTLVSHEILERRTLMSAFAVLSLGQPHVALGDVNGDGKADVITVRNELRTTSTTRSHKTHKAALTVRDAAVSVRLGNGDGTFGRSSKPVLLPAVQASDVIAADFDGDGKTDVAILESKASVHPGGVNILQNDGKGNLTDQGLAGQFDDAARGQFLAADFNGDGRLDLAVNQQGIIAILIGLLRANEGTSNTIIFAEQQTTQLPFNHVRNIAVADFDGDGSVDVAAGLADGSVRLAVEGDGSVFKDAGPISRFPGSVYVAAGDVNGDGVADLVMMGDGSVRTALGSKSGLLPAVQSQLRILPYIEQDSFLADVNHDGQLDLVFINPHGQARLWALGQPGGTFAALPVRRI